MQFADLLSRVNYLPPNDVEVLSRAYDAAASAHHDQNRLSGEKFIEHPLSVAVILADLQLDRDTLAAAILHDTVEDTHLTIADLEQSFGHDVGKLVAGVTKLEKISFRSQEQAQAENVRKMLVAMAEDVRVVLMKLADRLHNMRTVNFLPEARRRAMAQETLDIYAPLAHRLGIWNIKWELEDLSFAQLHPEEYQEIVKKIARKRKERETYVNDVKEILERELTAVGIKADTTGRPKHVYSIAAKLAMGKDFDEIYDLSAIRVLTDSIKDCYGALGVIHSLWKPIPGRFKDYIAMPKSNGYQSLHTTVVSHSGEPMEIQIRTQEMHDVAERGVAAHWRYREHVPAGATAEDSVTYEWLRDMVDLLERGDSAEEVLEHSKLAMYQDQVFCFTPKGSLISLPRGATPIDFAYAVHTDLGNSAVGAKVNGNHVALHIPLNNGDQVEIITTRDSSPSPMWEQFVVTGRARAEIRRFLRHAQRDEHVRFGRKILDKVFSDEGRELTDKAIEEVAKKLRLAKAEDVYADVGRGALRGAEVLQAVFPELKRAGKVGKKAKAGQPKPISIRGLTEGISYNLGQCCHPLPGDRIVGITTPGEGLVIHTIDCAELDKAHDMTDWLDVGWGQGASDMGLSVARILVRIKNMPGSLATAMSAIAANGGNIFNMKVTDRNPLYFEFMVDVEVRDVAHLQNILGALRVSSAVESVDRVREAEGAVH